jgi:phospholipase C
VPACVPDYNNPLPTLTSDRKASDGGAIVHSPVPHVPTLMDRLDKAGVSWKLYTSLKSSGSTAYVWSICPVFADCLYTAQSSNMEAPSQVVTDAQNGTLPQFSVVLPTGPSGATSQHNGTSMLKGDNWIGSVLSAVMSGPEWGSTAVFITYDDCGCFYDHVPPPRAALGIRNPMVIVSPYARPGYTDSTVASTASMLAFTEQTFGLNPLTKADANAYNYLNAFDFSQTPLSPLTMTRSKIPAATKTFIRRHPPNPDDPT